MGAAGAAAGVGIGSSMAGGIIAGKEDIYQSEILLDNARVADQIADQAIWRGEVAARRHQQELSQVKGSQRAAIADAGFDASFGTSLDILADTAGAGAEDAVIIRYNAELERWQAKNQKTAFKNEARLLRWGAPLRAGFQAAGATGRASGAYAASRNPPPNLGTTTARGGGTTLGGGNYRSTSIRYQSAYP